MRVVIAALTVVVIVAVVVAFSSSREPTPVGETTTLATRVARQTTSTSTTAASARPGIIPLDHLLPDDVAVHTGCSQNQASPMLTGLTKALVCTPANLPGGQIFAFQFDSQADYATSLIALNKFKGFDATTAGATCPPNLNPQDSIGWHSKLFPTRTGQILECLAVGINNSQPDYIWTYPSEYAIIDAQAAEHSSFADLHAWWTSDVRPPP